jgi:uncharacterized protein YndB with AHSA1/START domain
MNDRIEKSIELKAPVSRTWKALTDYQEFGKWFCVKLEDPFVPGHVSRGHITYPGYENHRMEVIVQKWSLSDCSPLLGIHMQLTSWKIIVKNQRH